MPPSARRRVVVAAVPAALALAACGSHTPSYAPATPPQPGLAIASSITAPIKVGLVVTGSSPRGEGQDDLGLAGGARVAEYRLGLVKKGAVTLDVQDDHGTAAGSTAAVKQLLADGVVGIVYASEGAHLASGVAAAQAAHVAVLLPYDPSAPTGAGTWMTGPTDQQAVGVLGRALTAQHYSRPIVLSTEDVAGLSAVEPAATSAGLTSDSTLGTQVTAAVAKVGTTGGPDSIVVWGSAADEADAVAAIQRQAGAVGSTIPVYLGPSALSGVFAQQLTTLGAQGTATTAGQYVTAGVDATDNTATPAMQAFLQSVRLAAADASVGALLSTQTFSADGAATADPRAHDAVLALVDAAATAHSTDPAAVSTALASLTTPATLGLAGPVLDFHQPAAVADDDVAALQATAQPSGLRAGVAQTLPALTWFAQSTG